MSEPSGYRCVTDPETPDGVALEALASGRITVDPEVGAIFGARGRRAEVLHKKTAYGRVAVRRSPVRWAMAHRVIWLSVHGFIPSGLHVNHKNHVRWDNRIANLELVTPSGNVAHWRGKSYAALSSAHSVDEIMQRVALPPAKDRPEPVLISNFLLRCGSRNRPRYQ